MFVQVAQYRSTKEEARRAKLAEEQAELDDMQKKQAEEDVCFLSAWSLCLQNFLCLSCLLHLSVCACVCILDDESTTGTGLSECSVQNTSTTS